MIMCEDPEGDMTNMSDMVLLAFVMVTYTWTVLCYGSANTITVLCYVDTVLCYGSVLRFCMLRGH